jgi:uncharacterized protein YggE
VHPVVAGAVASSILAGALVVGLLLGGHAGLGGGFASTVVPAAPTSTGSDAASQGAAASGTTPADRLAAGAPAASSLAPTGSAVPFPGPILYNQCAPGPTVQFQGRGLAVTGSAPITTTGPALSTLSVSIQERGNDPATVIGNAQARVQAIVTALEQAGVPRTAIQPSYFSSYGTPSAGNYYAYASVSAQVTSDQLAAASRAVLQVGGVTGYSNSSTLPAQPSAQEVQAAVGLAAAQARSMAVATASAVGVRLGDAQSVATQPPALCYGTGGPSRVVQVTVTYALR